MDIYKHEILRDKYFKLMIKCIKFLNISMKDYICPEYLKCNENIYDPDKYKLLEDEYILLVKRCRFIEIYTSNKN